MSKTSVRRIATYRVARRTCQKKQKRKMPRTELGAVHGRNTREKNCHVRSRSPYMAKTPERRIVTYGVRRRTCQKKQKRRLPRMESRAVHGKNTREKNCHVRSRPPYMSKEAKEKIATYRVARRTCQMKQKRKMPRTELRAVHGRNTREKNCHVRSHPPYVAIRNDNKEEF